MGGAGEVKGTLPPGFRFHPTDEELITHYLGHKVSNTNFAARAIADVDFNKCEPWDLPGRAKMGEKAWYFFSTRDRKYPTGVRTNRATNTGYWKTTGKDKEIFCSATAELLGMKKTLVFYKGRAPRGEKSNWVMHEYRLHTKSVSSSKVSKGSSSSRLQDEWVVCRVFQKSSVGKKSPMNHPRANPHNLGVAPPLMSTPVIQGDHFLHPPYHFGSQLGRSYADLAELTRALRWNHGMDLPVQYSQWTYAGSSALPGLNLNLVAPLITPPPGPMQPVPRLPASLPQQLQVAADASSMSAASVVLPGCNLPADEGFGAAQLDINAHSAGGRWFQQVDRCVDLDGCHWPSY